MTEEARFMRKLRKVRREMSKEREMMTAEERLAHCKESTQDIMKYLEEHGLKLKRYSAETDMGQGQPPL